MEERSLRPHPGPPGLGSTQESPKWKSFEFEIKERGMVCSRCPRECRYFEIVLKKKSLRKLKDNVWENKTRWELDRKAVAHHRSKLLRRCFNGWILFLQKSLKKRIDVRAAECFYEDKLKRKGMSCLRRNAELGRVLSRVWKKKVEWNAKFGAWHLWKHYTQKRLKLREINVLADRIREERLLVRFFYLWSFRYKEKISLEGALGKASKLYDRKLKEKAFASWKVFKNKEICKKQIQRLSTSCYEDKLSGKVFRSWRKYARQKSMYRSRIRITGNFYQTHLVGHYLSLWVAAHRKLKAERKARDWALAVDHCRRKMLERGFEGFVRIKERKWVKEEKARKFKEVHEKAHLSFYLDVWVTRRTEKLMWNDFEATSTEWREFYLTELLLAKLWAKYRETVEEQEKMEKVDQYSNAIIVHRAFKAWKEVTARRFVKKLKIQTADRFNLEKLTRKTFDRWKTYTVLKTQKAAATAYYKNRLLAKATHEWRSFVEERKAILRKVRSLQRNHELNLLRQPFQAWKNAVAGARTLTTLAVAFHNKSSLLKVFAAWKTYSRDKSAGRLRYTSNRDVLNGVRIKNVLSRWRKMLMAKHDLRRKIEEVREKQNKRALSLHFNIWRKLVEKMKSIRQAVAVFPQLQSTLLLEEYMSLLCKALPEKRIFKRKEELARRTEEKLMKRRCLRRWVSFVCWKKEKLRFLSEEKTYEDRRPPVGVPISSGRGCRKKPKIPEYLKQEFRFDQYSETSFPINEETFSIEEPVNKKLPVVGLKEAFASFDEV